MPINRSIATKTCQKFCQNPWEEVYIRYNGDLTPCNMLNPYIYGNLNNSDFVDLWTGLNAELFRKFLNSENRHQYCQDCYYLI
ncbi:MAG: SPASM domain-containing protein [Candidatus Lokiarchaeota archaeon]|nr:SPASM domain-containing protein [Candidatus Lokiarchaeota archaeon]